MEKCRAFFHLKGPMSNLSRNLLGEKREMAIFLKKPKCNLHGKVKRLCQLCQVATKVVYW